MNHRLIPFIILSLLLAGCVAPKKKKAPFPEPPMPAKTERAMQFHSLKTTDNGQIVASISKTGAQARISWTGGLPGTLFQLRTKTNVLESAWRNIGGVSTNTFAFVPISGPLSLYSVQGTEQPPPTNTPGQLLWLRTTSGGTATALSVKSDRLGNVIVVGKFGATVNFGGGNVTAPTAGTPAWSIFIAKYGSANQFLWVKALGNLDYSAAQSVAIDSSNNIVVGGYFAQTVNFGGGPLTAMGAYDVFVAKFSPDGTHLWSKKYGGSGTDGLIGMPLALDANNNVLLATPLGFTLTADFGGITVTNAGATDLVISKITAAGTTLWAKRYGNDNGEAAHGLAVDQAGDLFVTGELQGQNTDLGGGLRTATGTINIFLAKYSGANGSHVWSKVFGVTGNNYGYAAAASPTTGNVVMTGGFNGVLDFGSGPNDTGNNGGIFIAGFSPSGVNLWTKSTGGGGDAGFGVGFHTNGNRLAVTAKSYTVNFGTWPDFPTLFGCGYCVAEYNVTGNSMPICRWQKNATTCQSSSGTSVAFDGLNHLMVGGWFQGNANFDGITASANQLVPSTFVIQYAE